MLAFPVLPFEPAAVAYETSPPFIIRVALSVLLMPSPPPYARTALPPFIVRFAVPTWLGEFLGSPLYQLPQESFTSDDAPAPCAPFTLPPFIITFVSVQSLL